MITVVCPCPQTVRARPIYYIPQPNPQVRNTPEPWGDQTGFGPDKLAGGLDVNVPSKGARAERQEHRTSERNPCT